TLCMTDISLEKTRETAILVGIITQEQNEEKSQEYLDELIFLADTAGLEVKRVFTQRVINAHPKTFIGSGKVEEIAHYVIEHAIDVVVFDDELSPSQLRNLEKELQCKIIDRTNLILDIFAQRAQTAHAKVQVELAQYQYILPRLTRMW